MTAFDKLKDIAENPASTRLTAMTNAILDTIKEDISRPADGFAIASAVYCTLLSDIIHDCLISDTEEGVISAIDDTTAQVRELIVELKLAAPELAQRAKERK